MVSAVGCSSIHRASGFSGASKWTCPRRRTPGRQSLQRWRDSDGRGRPRPTRRGWPRRAVGVSNGELAAPSGANSTSSDQRSAEDSSALTATVTPSKSGVAAPIGITRSSPAQSESPQRAPCFGQKRDRTCALGPVRRTHGRERPDGLELRMVDLDRPAGDQRVDRVPHQRAARKRQSARPRATDDGPPLSMPGAARDPRPPARRRRRGANRTSSMVTERSRDQVAADSGASRASAARRASSR